MRLIDGSALLKELRKMQRECEKDGEEMGGEAVLLAEGIDSACEIVKAAKVVDPFIYAVWEQDKEDLEKARCTNCMYQIGLWSHAEINYCPNCGAKMKLKLR